MQPLLPALVLFTSMWLTPLLAHAEKGAVEVKSIAEKEIKSVVNGKTEVKRVPVKSAPPDTKIIYTTTFKNISNKPVNNIALTNPVPEHTVYEAGSAQGDNTDIQYSVDGGKTYGAATSLKVKGKDDSERPATTSDYTHIRWVYKGELAVGKESSVSFISVVK
ncbi:hypothetical protein [Methylophilus medardicus]|uniref:DUF11 domain-containing protein n=1 Tax=Methylophilus medardicus TaxID=2588534 RepID=A0A5B8CSH2_9PROT|nr:hypothetical protein [Methylophilus medardicus]QDC44264.1 hypothetical protein FIU01_06835 [Methylophilus medardicus]QDC49271.1 hypothetical protein FIU00_06835 [Methylophilus medardicus]QDC52976.1 hypothetical protein FIT99_06835 [Methylophilus medardicus]